MEHIRTLMREIEEAIRDIDPDRHILYTKGGVFFVSEFYSLQEAEYYAMHVAMTLEGKMFRIHNIPVKLSVVIGIAGECEELALAVAKQCTTLGKEICHFKDIYANLNISNKLYKLRLLEDAIKNDRIEPVFHPIVNTKLRHVDKFEVLTRIYTSTGKPMSIYNFFDVMHEQDFYTQVTLTSFSKALDIIATYEYEFSLNLSMFDIHNRELIEFIVTHMQEKPYVGRRLVLELLEVESDEDYRNFKAFSQEMAKFGVSIAIDDFGTGYSNFERIIELEPRYVKIDGSIIRRLPSDKVALALTRSISTFCGEVGIDTVAEFVEDEDIYRIVRDLGITYCQGFYFHKPLTREEFLKKFG